MPLAAAVEEVDSENRTRRPAGGRPAVIWIGFDGLDWNLLDRLGADNRMPNWKRLTAQGYSARLKSFMPFLSPIVWTTIATGVGPDVHRVLDFQEVDPASGQRVPISGRSRAVPAIWNVATSSGRSVGVVGWWATHPAEEVSGFFVSDHVSPILFDALPRTGVAYPSSLSPGVEQVLARDGSVADAELARFVAIPEPEIRRARESGDLKSPVVALARILASTRVQQRIGRDLYDKNPPDLMMLYFEGTDAIGHVFGPYVPPRMSCISEEDFARYRRAVDEYYSLVDRMLGQWMRRADEDGATLIVNSDHGFKWGAERPCETSSLRTADAAFWHRMDGVVAIRGTRVAPSSERKSASVFDLAPTVSALLDLPVDRRASGKVLRSAFREMGIPDRKDLFGAVAVRRLAQEAMSAEAASEYTKRLLALGYISGGEPTRLAPPGGDRPGLTEKSWHNLGLYMRDSKGDLGAAEAAFHKAVELQPTYVAPQFTLAKLYRDRGDDRKAIEWLVRSCQAGHADPEDTILQWFVDYDALGKSAQARQVLERGVKAYPASEAISRELGLLHYRARRCTAAWDSVARFEAVTRTPDTLNVLALLKGCLGQRDESIAFFEKSLAIRPDQPAVVRSIDALRRR
jgi:predicted AlkP superfamily phosphohydrolase/phosphomutase